MPPAGAALNDRAYGFGEDGFRAGFSGETAIRWHGAFEGDEPLACVGTIDAGEGLLRRGGRDSPPSTAAAASPDGCSGERWRRRGRTAIVFGVAASQSGGRGRSMSASASGDLGCVEMWELRR